ncbi:MAG: nitroreductase family protein [Sedimentisphaerales bacterium]|nr:nitroreductase family protein [Sedimentisphaerales bacterium]
MDVHQAIRNRRSVRAYDHRTIPADVMQRLKDALRFAPSACNIQPWRFIMVTDPALRQKLPAACKGQTWISQAPLTVVACGYPQDAYKTMGGSDSAIPIDLSIALDHLSLAAVAEGLGTCWIGAFEEQLVKDLLGIPADVKVVALMSVGYPKSPELNCPIDPARRKAEAEIFCHDRYQT